MPPLLSDAFIPTGVEDHAQSRDFVLPHIVRSLGNARSLDFAARPKTPTRCFARHDKYVTHLKPAKHARAYDASSLAASFA